MSAARTMGESLRRICAAAPSGRLAKVLQFPKARKAKATAKVALAPRQLEIPPALLHMLALHRTAFGWRRKGPDSRLWLPIALHHATCRLSARRRSAELAPLLKAWGFRPRRILTAAKDGVDMLPWAAIVVGGARLLQDWLEDLAPGVGDDLRALCAGHIAEVEADPWRNRHWPIVGKVRGVLTIRNPRDGRPRLHGGGLDVSKERRGRPMRDYAAVPAPLEHVLAAASKVEGVHPWTTVLTLLAISERRLHLGRAPDTTDVAWTLGLPGSDLKVSPESKGNRTPSEAGDNARGGLRRTLAALRKAGLAKADGTGRKPRWKVARGEAVWGWKPKRKAKRTKAAADPKDGRKALDAEDIS